MFIERSSFLWYAETRAQSFTGPFKGTLYVTRIFTFPYFSRIAMLEGYFIQFKSNKYYRCWYIFIQTIRYLLEKRTTASYLSLLFSSLSPPPPLSYPPITFTKLFLLNAQRRNRATEIPSYFNILASDFVGLPDKFVAKGVVKRGFDRRRRREGRLGRKR